MNRDAEKKGASINFRCHQQVRDQADRIAALKTGGNLALAMEQMIDSVFRSLEEHGERTYWPPVIEAPIPRRKKLICIRECPDRLLPDGENAELCFNITCDNRKIRRNHS